MAAGRGTCWKIPNNALVSLRPGVWTLFSVSITYMEHCYVGDQNVPPQNVDNCDGENKEVILGSPLPTLLAYSQEKTF